MEKASRDLRWEQGRTPEREASKITKTDPTGTSNEGRRWLRKMNDLFFFSFLAKQQKKKKRNNLKVLSWS